MSATFRRHCTEPRNRLVRRQIDAMDRKSDGLVYAL